MKLTLNVNLAGGILFLLLSTVLWFLVPSQIKITGQSLINSQTFPKLVIGVIFIFSLYLILFETVKIIGKKKTETIEVHLKKEVQALVTIAILGGYAFLFEKIGFFISSVIFCWIMLIFSRNKNWKYYLTVALVCGGVNYIFRHLLLVQLP